MLALATASKSVKLDSSPDSVVINDLNSASNIAGILHI